MKVKLRNLIEKFDIDWKWILIFYLLIKKSGLIKGISYVALALAGISSYPNFVFSEKLYSDLSQKVATTFLDAFRNVYTAGFNWGETIYPYNVLIAKIIGYLIQVFSWTLIVLLFLFVITKVYFVIHNQGGRK